MIGIAIRLAVTTESLTKVGYLAALIEVAARVTPASTNSHAPCESIVANINTNVDATIPKTAMEIRAAIPSGAVAHSGSTSCGEVITRY